MTIKCQRCPRTFVNHVSGLYKEAKGNYDQLLEKFFDENDDPKYNFDGFTSTKTQIFKQGTLVKKNPPTKLMWYFQTPQARLYLMDTLVRAGVPSIYQP
ncbi:Tox-REase-5 domain-containing protein [Paraburkholderia terricola]|uniref:Tox-REase-5 domain-containing protein n=1 Tax=Paraburkholderia terricola TaxID=169427 RepID=UPI00286C6700|nr:Tox-REase-5 domain-containing protein [Paraburkholderia terricola]